MNLIVSALITCRFEDLSLKFRAYDRTAKA